MRLNASLLQSLFAFYEKLEGVWMDEEGLACPGENVICQGQIGGEFCTLTLAFGSE